ncbi:MAG: phosphotransferase [Devosia sp.]
MTDIELPLQGGRVTAGVVRVGETVRRPVTGDRADSQELLRYLEGVGCDAAPQFLGVDAQGRDVLSFLPGDVPLDIGHYDDLTLGAAASLLRRFHDATVEFAPVRAVGAEVMCHNDWGPPNAVFRDGRPVGMIDFDTVKPGLRLWDIGYSAFSWLDLGDRGYTGDEQIRRLRVFADGYGHAEYSAATIAVFAVARQTALSVAGEARGKREVARWAAACARWTVANVTEKLLPTGMMAAR